MCCSFSTCNSEPNVTDLSIAHGFEQAFCHLTIAVKLPTVLGWQPNLHVILVGMRWWYADFQWCSLRTKGFDVTSMQHWIKVAFNVVLTLMRWLGGAVRADVDEVGDWRGIGELQDSCKAGNLLSRPKCHQLLHKLSNIKKKKTHL